jgi:hypothetical protein
MTPSIQTPGPPPERHADRLVAEMLRHLAVTRAQLTERISDAIIKSSDGSPKAQGKMLERIQRAGASYAKLSPGKRGRYSLCYFDWTGWDAARGVEIKLNDLIPPKPQIVCWLNSVRSNGQGRCEVSFRGAPFLFITHHVLSRTAQRFGARTLDDLSAVVENLSSTTIKLFVDNDLGFVGDDRWAKVPPMGWRIPLGGDAVVVLKKHENHPAFVAATVI